MDSKTVVTVHVKNTGRTSILQPGILVSLSQNDNPNRKTKYDLIAAKKYNQFWINIDSQVPNKLVNEGLMENFIKLAKINRITKVKPETTFLNSRIDFSGKDDSNNKFLLEVKGVTLFNKKIGAFPDAPTQRGLKHVKTLTLAAKSGYLAYLLFIVQTTGISIITIDREIFPELAEAIKVAMASGVIVLAYDCKVTPDSISLNHPIKFDLNQKFKSDGLPSSIGLKSDKTNKKN